MVKQIGVIGYECEDIIIYLAGIFTALGKKAAIVDRSEQELLCEILGIPAGVMVKKVLDRLINRALPNPDALSREGCLKQIPHIAKEILKAIGADPLY